MWNEHVPNHEARIRLMAASLGSKSFLFSFKKGNSSGAVLTNYFQNNNLLKYGRAFKLHLWETSLPKSALTNSCRCPKMPLRSCETRIGCIKHTERPGFQTVLHQHGSGSKSQIHPLNSLLQNHKDVAISILKKPVTICRAEECQAKTIHMRLLKV